MTRKMRLRQRLIPGRSVGLSSTRERKKEACRASTGHSTPAFAICLTDLGDVVLLRVAVFGPDEGEAVVLVAEVVDLEPVLGPDARDGQGLQREDDRVLRQRVEVLHALPHRERRGLLSAIQEHPCSGNPVHRGLRAPDLVDELPKGALDPESLRGDELPPAIPGDHHEEEDEGDRQRQPGAVGDLGQVRRKEPELDRKEERSPTQSQPEGAVPAVPDDEEEEDRSSP